MRLFGLVLAAGLALLAASSSSAAAAPRRALLARGADPVKGLPFFSPNAIAALRGSYDLAEAGAARGAASGAVPASPAGALGSRGETRAIQVWYSREGVVFSEAWKRLGQGEAGAYAEAAFSLERGAARVLALRAEGYALFFELTQDPKDAGAELSFVRAFAAKFALYFRNAQTDAELSFPAFVDY